MSLTNLQNAIRCTHCNTNLVEPGKYRKSAQIPGKENHFYGLCNCGNVMVLAFEEDQLLGVEPTGQASDEETDRMIIEASELFAQAGARQGAYGYTKNDVSKSVSDLKQKYEATEEPKASVDAYVEEYKETPEEAPQGFWKRIWSRVTGAFK